jgi:hypothetical protein
MAHVIIHCQGPGSGPRSPFFSGITDFSSPLAQPGLLVWQRPHTALQLVSPFPLGASVSLLATRVDPPFQYVHVDGAATAYDVFGLLHNISQLRF